MLSVGPLPAVTLMCSLPDSLIAKKEDSPEEALKAFKVIVEREEEKGDWYAPFLKPVIIDIAAHIGASRL